jgi:hypothetical protein
MLRKFQITLALWLLRRNIPQRSESKPSRSSNTQTVNSDPCLEQRNAKIESGLDIVRKYEALEAAMILDWERAQALMLCEMENQGGGSNEGGPEGP